MKKLFALMLIALLFPPLVFASVGYQKEGENVGEITVLNVQGNSTFAGDSVVTIIANGHKDGVTTNVSTESNLTSAALAYGVILIEGGSAKSIALADGVKGQMVTIIMTVYDGKTVTVTDDQVGAATTKTGWDDLPFNAVNDAATLLYVDDTTGWIVVGQYSVTIT